MRYRLQRHDGTDCSATMVPITVLRMVPIQRYRQGKMTSPIICYILLGVILFIILMRILSILQFLRLKRKVKKRISPKHDKPSCK